MAKQITIILKGGTMTIPWSKCAVDGLVRDVTQGPASTEVCHGLSKTSEPRFSYRVSDLQGYCVHGDE